MRALAEDLARRWSDEPISFVRSFANVVYRLGARHYLRLTAETHRTEAQLRSELELLRALRAKGVRVCQAVASRQGEVVHEAAHAGVRHFAVLFEAAPGRPFDWRTDSHDDALLRHIGHTMAALHLSLKDFEGSATFTRFRWHEDRWTMFERCVPRREREAWDAYDRLME